MSSVTWLADVISFRVAVGSVADWCVVWVRGQLMIQLLWAVDKNRQMLHLVGEGGILKYKKTQLNQTSTTRLTNSADNIDDVAMGSLLPTKLHLPSHSCL